MKGIDVSSHQGAIDWQKVKAAGIEFAMIRAGYGMYENQVDKRFADNMTGAAAAGIPVGVYWYSYAASLAEAIKEAEVCLKVIGPYKGQIRLPVAYDWEDKTQGAMTAETTAACCKAFLDRVKGAGYRPMLYSFSNWLQTRLCGETLDGIPRWVAHYGVKSPVCSKPYLMWQHSSKGTVDGIVGAVDLDEGYEGLLLSGWKKEGGSWYWYEDGAFVHDRWVESSGRKYRLGADGKMLTGLCVVEEKRYCFHFGGGGLPEGALIVTDESGVVKG